MIFKCSTFFSWHSQITSQPVNLAPFNGYMCYSYGSTGKITKDLSCLLVSNTYNWIIIIIIIIIITITTTTTIIIIIIIAFKGTIRDFLQCPHSAANCLQHIRSSGPGAIVCKSCATHWALITCKCHITCHLVWRDSSAIKFDRIEIKFIWALFYWLDH